MNEIKLSNKAKEAIKALFIESAEMTRKEFYDKDYENRKNAESFFHGVLEAKFSNIGVDISEVWEIIRDTIYHD